MEKLTYLKLGITCLYVLFVVLIVSGALLVNEALTMSSLVAFTAALTLTTYYLALIDISN